MNAANSSRSSVDSWRSLLPIQNWVTTVLESCRIGFLARQGLLGPGSESAPNGY